MTTEGPRPLVTSPPIARGSASTGPGRAGPDPSRFGLGPGAEPLPGYHLISRIGGGRAGELWKATGPGGFPLAMKFLESDGPFAEDELRSIALTANVRHPNLLTVFGTWRVGGVLILGMDLAEGTLMGRWARYAGRGEPGIPARRLAVALMEAARGLDCLNRPYRRLRGQPAFGLIHRDVRPENLLLVGGSVKVGGLGLVAPLRGPGGPCDARAAGEDVAPPEWASGRLSPQTDQFALALAYCRLAVGCRPAPAGDSGRDDPGGGWDLSIHPEGRRAALARALALRPEDRWPDCRSFVRELFRASPSGGRRPEARPGGKPASFPSPPIPPRLPVRAAGGRRWLVAAGTMTALALAARWSPQLEVDRRARPTPPVVETAPLEPVPEDPRPEPAATRDDRGDVDARPLAGATLQVRAEVALAPGPSRPTTAEADRVEPVEAAAGPSRRTARRAFESLWRFGQALERLRPIGLGGNAPDPAARVGIDPAARPVVAEVIGPSKAPPTRGTAGPGVTAEGPSGAAEGRPGPIAEGRPPRGGSGPAPGGVARPKAATITVLLPGENAELVVRGEVGKGDPDEWYGPKRVIHSPPLSEEKDYLIGTFWTDRDGQRRTRAVELKVKPARSYEVDLRASVPSSKEVDH